MKKYKRNKQNNKIKKELKKLPLILLRTISQATNAVFAKRRPKPTNAIPNTNSFGISSFSLSTAAGGSGSVLVFFYANKQ